MFKLARQGMTHRTGRAYIDPAVAGQPSVDAAGEPAFKPTETRSRYADTMPTQHFIDNPTPTGIATWPRRIVAGHRTMSDIRHALARNIVVARCIVAWPGSQSGIHPFLKTIVELAVIAVVGSTLVAITSGFAAVNALLTVGFVGIAAGRCAAAFGNRRTASGRRSPANDNPFGCVLPPPLLRC